MSDFTGTGIGPAILVRHQDTIRYNLTGTFSATMALVKSQTGGKTWDILLSTTTTATGNLLIENKDAGHALIAWQCSAFTSGTAVGTLSPALNSAPESVEALSNYGKQTIVCIGDSIFQNGVTTSSTTNIITARNFLEQACAKLGQRIRVINNAGLSGDTTAEALARFEAEVTPYRPSWVIADCGVNDFAAPRTGLSVYNDLLQMYYLCQQIGANFLTIGSVAAGGFNVAANFTQYSITMDLCQQSAIKMPNWYHFPASVAITDYSTLAHSYYSFPATNTTYDNETHPSAYGSGLLSTLFYNFFNSIIPSHFLGSGANRNATAGDTSNLVGDSCNVDTTGVATNGAIAGITGTYSGLWFPARTGSIASAMTQEARDHTLGQPGNWQVFTLTSAAAATDYVTYAQTIDITTSGYMAGDKFYVEADFLATTSLGTLGQLEIQIQALDAAFSILYTSAWNRINSAPEYLGWASFTGRASTRSAPLTLTTNAGGSGSLTKYILVTIKVATSASGAAILKVGGVEVRKLIN